MAWTRIINADEAAKLLPAWFAGRMIGLRGTFGLLLASGDVLRITSIAAVHQSPEGHLLLDVLLDHAGIPEGVDLAWRSKHYLGAPVPAATLATVNVSHILTFVEFVAAEIVEPPGDVSALTVAEIKPEPVEEDAAGAITRAAE